VVGASLSGLRIVQALRRRGCEDEIVMLGDELHAPYDRPPLSKGVLSGTRAAETVALATAEQLAALDVDLRLGTPARGLDTPAHTVTLDDAALDYDRLVVATGSSPRRLPGTAHLTGVHVLRTLRDAQALREALDRSERLVVVGGGFIGCEVAAVARAQGVAVAVVDPVPVLMRRGLGDDVGARMTRRHAAHGVALHLGRGVARLLGETAGEGVELDDGTVLAADTVVVGIGAVPNTGWLDGSGLTVADGVVCDGVLRAGPDVYAVGDVARWDHPRYGSVRVEHWTAATEHATAVAATLTGTPTEVSGIPYVWTDQYGSRLQVAGRLDDADTTEVLLDDGDRFLVRGRRAGEVVGVAGLGVTREFVKERMALATTPVSAGAGR